PQGVGGRPDHPGNGPVGAVEHGAGDEVDDGERGGGYRQSAGEWPDEVDTKRLRHDCPIGRAGSGLDGLHLSPGDYPPEGCRAGEGARRTVRPRLPPKERHTGHLPTSYEGGVTDSRSVEPVVVVAVVEVVALGGGHGGDLGGEPLEIRLAWGPGAKWISISAGAPDSLRNPWMPPNGTWTKSPGTQSTHRLPS